MSKIAAIASANAPYVCSMKDFPRHAGRLLSLNAGEENRLSRLYSGMMIENRRSVIPDFSGEESLLFSENLIPGIGARMAIFRQYAAQISIEAVEAALERAGITAGQLTGLITVSCTGLHAPGLELELAGKLGLNPEAKLFSVNFMGCYAAFHGLKIADSFCRNNPGECIAVVCTELCSIHFSHRTDAESLIANGLFADGSAAAIVTGEGYSSTLSPALQMEEFHSVRTGDDGSMMAWQVGEHGFEMRLSAYIPSLVNAGLKQLVEKLEANHMLPADFVPAIHPGGKKVLEEAGKALNFNSDDMAASYEVLAENGNMSSATILFVLEKLLYEKNLSSSTPIFAAAFGPGLTVESAVLRVL